VVVPLAWVVLDPASDELRVAPDGTVRPPGTAAAVEVAAEPSEFEEDGRRWLRAPTGSGGYVYAPAERAGELLTPGGRSGLGIA